MSASTPIQSAAKRRHVGRTLLALLVSALVTAGLSTWAAVAAPRGAGALVGWSTGVAAVLITAAVGLTAWSLQRAAYFRTRAEKTDDAAAKLADETLPSLVTRLRSGSSVDNALSEIEHPRNPAFQRILRTLGQEIGHGERARASAMLACANAAGRMQALATNMLASLRDMEERHDEAVLGDLLELDHTTAQAGRLADSIAVLTGARTGRRWTKPIVMESILRGAVGRIAAYKRVRLHNTSNSAVVGYAAEGVMHALAELMDNATTFSPPSELAHVYVEEVHSGIVVNIEDGGLVMSETAMKRAVAAVGPEPLDLSTLNGTRLGLAVVGCLARKHGLTVSFRPSSRGGTGVVVMIPRKLITQPRRRDQVSATGRSIASGGGAEETVQTPRTAAAAAADQVAAAPTIRTATGTLTREDSAESPAEPDTSPQLEQPAAATPAPAPAAAAEQPAEDSGIPELPKRRRGQTLAATSPALVSDEQDGEEPAKPARPRPNPGERFGAFRRAGRSAQEPNSDDAQQ